MLAFGSFQSSCSHFFERSLTIPLSRGDEAEKMQVECIYMQEKEVTYFYLFSLWAGNVLFVLSLVFCEGGKPQQNSQMLQARFKLLPCRSF